MIEREFERAFDEVFEDLLIKRWRGSRRLRNLGKAVIAEDEENYRVTIAVPDVDPEKIEVEVSAWRLTMLIPTEQGREENALDFSHRIDTEHVTARFEADILEITIPKARGRKVEVR
jgi:HSP20 family molecular chaperone IbpA